MTETEWLACADPKSMLKFLRGKASDRKLRLFAVGYCRSIWPSLKSIRSRRAVETSELYADGRTDRKSMRAAGNAAMAATRDAHASRSLAEWMTIAAAYNAARNCAFSDPWDAARFASGETRNAAHVNTPLGRCLASLLREIFDNPFRPSPFLSPAVLAWNDGTVRRIAESIYEERTFDRLPILADVLEDAGCHDADILAHCRGPGLHVRGCWLVDLLFGKT
jgi:hypothetical protein